MTEKQRVGVSARQRVSEFEEPWCMDEDVNSETVGNVLNAAGVIVVDPYGSTLQELQDEARYMRRIVASVNFCADVSTDLLDAIGEAGRADVGGLEALIRRNVGVSEQDKDLQKECRGHEARIDELLFALNDLVRLIEAERDIAAMSAERLGQRVPMVLSERLRAPALAQARIVISKSSTNSQRKESSAEIAPKSRGGAGASPCTNSCSLNADLLRHFLELMDHNKRLEVELLAAQKLAVAPPLTGKGLEALFEGEPEGGAE